MAGVPLPAFLLTQRVRSSTFSTSKYHSYPMDIITLLFTFVKCFTLFTQFCKIRFSYPIERHNRVFVIGMFRIKSQSYNDIQVTVGQMFYHQDSSGVFIVDKDLIRTEDRLFSVLFKQFVILSAAPLYAKARNRRVSGFVYAVFTVSPWLRCRRGSWKP